MEPDTAAVAGTVAASDATAAIVLVEDDQPGPSTSKEEGAAAAATAATEATVATEKGEKKKEVNRKGVCMRWTNPAPAPPRGPNLDLWAPTGTAELGGAGGRARGVGAAEQSRLRSPPPSLLSAGRAGAGRGCGAG